MQAEREINLRHRLLKISHFNVCFFLNCHGWWFLKEEEKVI